MTVVLGTTTSVMPLSRSSLLLTPLDSSLLPSSSTSCVLDSEEAKLSWLLKP